MPENLARNWLVARGSIGAGVIALVISVYGTGWFSIGITAVRTRCREMLHEMPMMLIAFLDRRVKTRV